MLGKWRSSPRMAVRGPSKNRSYYPTRYYSPLSRSFNRNFGAGVLQLLFDGVCLVLRDVFLDRLGRTLDERLGLRQAETGDLADNLDDLDLVGRISPFDHD